MNPAVCECHGEPCYWQKDRRKTRGGRWECAVKRRRRQRDLYDNDPVHRIEKRLRDDARDRRKSIERRCAALANDRGGC